MSHSIIGCASALRLGLARYLPPSVRALLGVSRIGIAGTGGLGSNVAFMLARSGIRQFTLVDFDEVDASNLNRQAFFPEDVGSSKVEALARHLRRLDQDFVIDTHAVELTAENAAGIFTGCVVVVEALDSARAKAMLFNALTPGGGYYVGASGLAGWGGPPMAVRRMGKNAVIVGDFRTDTESGLPPLAPRVMQAAAMQADQVLTILLGPVEPDEPDTVTPLDGGV